MERSSSSSSSPVAASAPRHISRSCSSAFAAYTPLQPSGKRCSGKRRGRDAFSVTHDRSSSLATVHCLQSAPKLPTLLTSSPSPSSSSSRNAHPACHGDKSNFPGPSHLGTLPGPRFLRPRHAELPFVFSHHCPSSSHRGRIATSGADAPTASMATAGHGASEPPFVPIEFAPTTGRGCCQPIISPDDNHGLGSNSATNDGESSVASSSHLSNDGTTEIVLAAPKAVLLRRPCRHHDDTTTRSCPPRDLKGQSTEPQLLPPAADFTGTSQPQRTHQPVHAFEPGFFSPDFGATPLEEAEMRGRDLRTPSPYLSQPKDGTQKNYRIPHQTTAAAAAAKEPPPLKYIPWSSMNSASASPPQIRSPPPPPASSSSFSQQEGHHRISTQGVIAHPFPTEEVRFSGPRMLLRPCGIPSVVAASSLEGPRIQLKKKKIVYDNDDNDNDSDDDDVEVIPCPSSPSL